MTKNIYKYAIILGVLFSGIAATARATTFIEGFEDVPLMDGMTQIQKDTISFGNEESRFVEAYLTAQGSALRPWKSFMSTLCRRWAGLIRAGATIRLFFTARRKCLKSFRK